MKSYEYAHNQNQSRKHLHRRRFPAVLSQSVKKSTIFRTKDWYIRNLFASHCIKYEKTSYRLLLDLHLAMCLDTAGVNSRWLMLLLLYLSSLIVVAQSSGQDTSEP